MASFYFYYSAMNAGKTTNLLQAAFNYRERGMRVLCFLPHVAAQFRAVIHSRIGISSPALILSPHENWHEVVRREHVKDPISCVMVDEAQFLSKEQVAQGCAIVDQENIPVLAYGLRTDFRGELFPGSQHLLAWADHIKEIKTVCFCGKKATMTARRDVQTGKNIVFGAQILCGDNETYTSFCRKHHHEMIHDQAQDKDMG